MVHEVDLRNDGLFADRGALYFLRFPDYLWRLMSSHTALSNRCRKSEYVRLLRAHGLSVEKMLDVEVLDEKELDRARRYLSPALYNGQDDLRAQSIFFAARRASW